MHSERTSVRPNIEVSKVYHRGGWQIAFHHAYSWEIRQGLKRLNGAKYSKTHECIYVPYTSESFAAFEHLGYDYTLIQPLDLSLIHI